MLMELQRQNMENIAVLMKQFQTGVGGGGMTDSRGIGRPITFKGEESKYAEWKAKLLAYLRVTNPKSDSWIQWSSKRQKVITVEDVDEEFETETQEVKEFAVKFYAILMSCTEDDAFRICHSVTDGNGLEAMRLLMKRYEPRTPGTKRALLKAVINNPPSKKPEDIEKNLMHVEELIKKYEVLGGDPLPEDLRVTVIIDLCTKDLKEHLELITREMKYKEVRDEIMSYVERKRDMFGVQLKAMEVDNHEESEATWWGGREDYEEEMYWDQESYSEVAQLGYKGKGPRYDYGFKGKGYTKGDKGGGKKGLGKGFGKDKGKGKGGGFQGYCHWCGEWGHSQSRCKWKDEYMEGLRKAQGSEKGSGQRADSVEEEGTSKQSQNGLETLEGIQWRSLCSLCSLVGNRFDPLTEEDEDFNEGENEVQVGSEDMKVMEVNNMYEKVNPKLDKEDLWITIDSGASENVISGDMAPQFEVKPSQGSRAGVKYVAANGEMMTNKGEKDVKVVTGEGHKCMLKMQVTDVRKPLMSVARICDAGHRVVFTKSGGIIQHESTGQTTKFQRIDNVYRLKVGVVDEKSGFTWQGM